MAEIHAFYIYGEKYPLTVSLQSPCAIKYIRNAGNSLVRESQLRRYALMCSVLSLTTFNLALLIRPECKGKGYL